MALPPDAQFLFICKDVREWGAKKVHLFGARHSTDLQGRLPDAIEIKNESRCLLKPTKDWQSMVCTQSQ